MAVGLGVASLERLHLLLNYILENALHVTLTQCARHLRDANLTSRERQLLKRELATELNTFLSGMTRGSATFVVCRVGFRSSLSVALSLCRPTYPTIPTDPPENLKDRYFFLPPVVRKSTIGGATSCSPKSKDRKTTSAFASSSSTLAATVKDHQYFKLVNVFIKQVLNK